jgi:hypothetical protein
MTELVEVAFGGPPGQEFIHGSASISPVIDTSDAGWDSCGSAIEYDSPPDTEPEWMKPLGTGTLDVSITVMADLDKVRTAGGHLGVDLIRPTGNIDPGYDQYCQLDG